MAQRVEVEAVLSSQAEVDAFVEAQANLSNLYEQLEDLDRMRVEIPLSVELADAEREICQFAARKWSLEATLDLDTEKAPLRLDGLKASKTTLKVSRVRVPVSPL